MLLMGEEQAIMLQNNTMTPYVYLNNLCIIIEEASEKHFTNIINHLQYQMICSRCDCLVYLNMCKNHANIKMIILIANSFA